MYTLALVKEMKYFVYKHTARADRACSEFVIPIAEIEADSSTSACKSLRYQVRVDDNQILDAFPAFLPTLQAEAEEIALSSSDNLVNQ